MVGLRGGYHIYGRRIVVQLYRPLMLIVPTPETMRSSNYYVLVYIPVRLIAGGHQEVYTSRQFFREDGFFRNQ